VHPLLDGRFAEARAAAATCVRDTLFF
jgi:hypothetical protein